MWIGSRSQLVRSTVGFGPAASMPLHGCRELGKDPPRGRRGPGHVLSAGERAVEVLLEARPHRRRLVAVSGKITRMSCPVGGDAANDGGSEGRALEDVEGAPRLGRLERRGGLSGAGRFAEVLLQPFRLPQPARGV